MDARKTTGIPLLGAILGLAISAPPGLVGGTTARAQEGDSDADREGFELFEKSIRPVLVQRCARCHAPESGTPRGGLSLATRDGMLRGGDSGPAVVPGDPEGSLLVQAIRHADDAPRMPPRGKLDPRQVAAFEDWVRRGAPAPGTMIGADRPAAGAAPAEAEPWSFRPPGDPPIPGGPARDPIDAFLSAELGSRGLPTAPPADRRTLLRRATFDLTGLPPAPEEVDAFLADDAPDAFARVVDRLLASPRYGERWARHWLDLVRYTDDFDEAWRYRDWVIKAFNDDRPYDRFVRDQIAGDLLTAPDPKAVNVDGIVATTLLSIGPWGGLDRPKRLSDIVDDQIDVVGRTFLGLTIACARCHDHKFDPITTADYYGLAGIFYSSHVVPEPAYYAHTTPRLKVPLVPPEDVAEHRRHQERVREREDRLRAAVEGHYADYARSFFSRIARYLLAARAYQERPADQSGVSAEDFARGRDLQGFALRRWVDYLDGPRLDGYRLLDQPVRDFDGEAGVVAWRTAAERPWWGANPTDHDVAIETFLLPARSVSVNPGTEGGAVAWRSPVAGTVRVSGSLTDGDPYDGSGVVWAIDHVAGDGRRHEVVSGTLPNGGDQRLDRGRAADRLGAIRVEPGDLIELQVALNNSDAHYDITNVALTIALDGGAAEWDLARDTLDSFLASNPHGDRRGHADVWRFSDMAGSHRFERMPAVDRLLARWDAALVQASSGDLGAIEAAAAEIERAVAEGGPGGPLARDLTGPRSPFWVKDRDDAKYLTPEARAALATLAGELEALRGQAPPDPCAHAIQEGGLKYGPHPGIGDARIHIRGSYERLGPAVPRRFPEALAGKDQPPISSGSGRLELANWIASADNPLTARVMVNRIWQHHFGEGLVRTPSNFGRRGEPPTYPALLDHLARRFVASGWSVKAMHRAILLSEAYRRSSLAPRALVEADPENRLLGRMDRRRLEAEELHDSLLALAGLLEHRGGGPADGDAASPRRLIYRNASRGERSDFGTLFDRADPSLHVEERTASTVAPQALFLMNHPLMQDWARGLARRPEVVAAGGPEARIAALYRLVYGRPPTEDEVALGLRFLAEAPPRADYVGPPAPPWDRYAQALLLTNEFLFVD